MRQDGRADETYVPDACMTSRECSARAFDSSAEPSARPVILSAFLACLASFFALFFRQLRRRDFFDRLDLFRLLFTEPLEIDVFDENRQRRFPALLAMIGELSEFLRIHSKLARHLDMHVRQMKPFACLDPGGEMPRNPCFFCHRQFP
jgi:hypothetical protein